MRQFIEAGAVKNRMFLSLLLTIPFIFVCEILYLPAILIFNYMVVEDYESQLIDMSVLALLGAYIILLEICAGPTTDKHIFEYILTPLCTWMFLHGMRNFTARKVAKIEGENTACKSSGEASKVITMPFLPSLYAGLLTVFVIKRFAGGINPNMYQMLTLSACCELLSLAMYLLGCAYIFSLKLNLKSTQEIQYQLGDGDVYVVPVLSMMVGSLTDTYALLWLATIYIVLGYAIRKYILKRGKA